MAHKFENPHVKTLPIVIGITGHRDLRPEDIQPLRDSITTIFRDMLTNYPFTPVTVLSSLAEGADRIGAMVAIEMGIDLICPLPFEKELYLADFSSDESKKEFEYILTQASSWFSLPLVEGAKHEDIVQHGHSRDMQYAQVGAYLAQHSQVMIALWDGELLEAIGGTGKVVHYKLHGVPKQFGREQSPLDPVETGPVYHILTPRLTNPDIQGLPYTIQKYYPRGYGSNEEAEVAFQKIFKQIDRFNEDTTEHIERLLEQKPQSEGYLYGKISTASFSDEIKSIIDHYSTADVLASYFQKHTRRAFVLIFTFVFCAALFFDLYAHLWQEPVVLLGYLFALLLAFAWYTFAKRKHYQTKYLDYRALAEGLRVQFFWRYIGLRHTAGDYYIRKQKSEMDWIRFAMRTAAIPRGDITWTKSEHIDHKPERLEAVMQSWVEDQANYYPKALRRDHKKLHKLERSIDIMFYIAIGLVFVLLLVHVPHEFLHFLVVATGLAPITAALIGGYIERNALVGHIKQYERMGLMFRQAREFLGKLLEAKNYNEASDFIFELGSEALAESGDWMLLHRDRPLEVPKG